ncbi:DUF4320 family protein [Acetobacterium malicum]|jgi:hypothetical protein|uniref:DUF4320 family protein n=1 Tax=Acetobacterium malicum TaxID=52692 RepID=A0ABR6YX03_9FIRM|nr:DUF4320 family protein [Acetobacterium malicum]MBC3899741.1 DUF4320 family protein [Acetobacterium malicum]
MKVDKGSAILEFSIFFLLAMFILTLIMGVLPVWTQYQKLNYIAHGVLRDAELVGNTGNTVMDTYEDLQVETGLKTKEISFSGTKYIGGSKNVQINDPIQVTVKSDFSWFSSFVGDGLNVELVAPVSGRSGVYYK